MFKERIEKDMYLRCPYIDEDNEYLVVHHSSFYNIIYIECEILEEMQLDACVCRLFDEDVMVIYNEEEDTIREATSEEIEESLKFVVSGLDFTECRKYCYAYFKREYQEKIRNLLL